MIYKHYKKYDIICFIDDDKSKFKAKIHGIPVLGNVNDIIKFNNFDEIFICCPSASESEMIKILEVCKNKETVQNFTIYVRII